MHADPALPDEPIHELVSTLPSAVRCGMDPREAFMIRVTTIAILSTCPECRRAKREAVKRGR